MESGRKCSRFAIGSQIRGVGGRNIFWVSFFQEGRKPNRKSETEPESPKTEPVTVYKETGETGTEETETAVCKKWYLCTVRKWVKLNRAEVLVPPFESSPRDLQNGHGLAFQGVSRKLDFCFSSFPVSSFEPISKKKTKNPNKVITRISDFSVARECKDPKELENNQKERG